MLTQVYGAQNATVKKITDSLNKEMERVSKGPNSTTPQTTTMVHEHKFGSIPGYVDDIGRSILKNPTTINEWADKNVNDYTTPKLAANSKK
jgi:hypothetical protein